MLVRRMRIEDLQAVAVAHHAAFVRQLDSEEWVACNFAAYPRIQIFVIQDGTQILGFIQWTQKSGFRKEVVLELEQLAVLPEVQGGGLGTRLIQESLPMVKAQLAERGASLKHIVVTTRADNAAQRLYRKALGAEVEAEISNLYSADEVFMVARKVD